MRVNTGYGSEGNFMGTVDVGNASKFVAELDLTDVPTHGKEYLGGGLPRFIPKDGEAQAVVVGSQVQAFTSGVDAKTRDALKNVMLLAQLAATKKAADDDVEGWYDTFLEVLSNTGLTLEEISERRSADTASQADVNKIILELAASLLGGVATTAYGVVVAALEALQKLEANSPTVTIFRRETHRESGRFQVSLAEEDGKGLAVSLVAFRFDSSVTKTQVLFFKFKVEEANVAHQWAKLSVADETFDGVAPLIAQKVRKYADGYVRQLKV
jgi:hypothetical protein